MSRGFTLMETLVALGLFTVAITIATDLFLVFQRVSRKTEGLEMLTAGARLTTERIAREVREGTIDFQRYASEGRTLSVNQHQSVLHLRDHLGGALTFRFADCSDRYEGNDCIVISDGAQEETLVSARVRVIDARFYIVPAESPFVFVADSTNPRAGYYASDTQPRITVFLALDNGRDLNAQDYVRYETQTTISSRSYLR